MRALLFLSILIIPLTTFSQNKIKLIDGEKIILEKRGNYLSKVFLKLVKHMSQMKDFILLQLN